MVKEIRPEERNGRGDMCSPGAGTQDEFPCPRYVKCVEEKMKALDIFATVRNWLIKKSKYGMTTLPGLYIESFVKNTNQRTEKWYEQPPPHECKRK